MDSVTVESVSSILKEYRDQVESLLIPRLPDYHLVGSSSCNSPYVALLRLEHIKALVRIIRQQIKQEISTKSELASLIKQCDEFINAIIDERIYVARKLLAATLKMEVAPLPPPSILALEVHTDDLASMRRRLLSSTSLVEDNVENQNMQHDLLQENILLELVDLTFSLKLLAVTFSNSLLHQDMHMLNDTSEAMIKNTSLFKSIDKNLSHYLENKTGGKISVMFLIKMVAALILAFVAVILLIKIVPQF